MALDRRIHWAFAALLAAPHLGPAQAGDSREGSMRPALHGIPRRLLDDFQDRRAD